MTMKLTTISPEQLEDHAKTVGYRNFEQSDKMAELLVLRGYQVDLVALLDNHNQTKVSAVLFSTPISGGLHMEIHYGPIYQETSDLAEFLVQLKDFAKKKKVIELEIKPYDTYQTYDDKGNELGQPNVALLETYKTAGYDFAGLTTGYETSDWHYIKDLTGLTAKTLRSSFSKKGKALVKKANTFGTTVRALGRSELEQFKTITESTSNRRQYTDKPLEYYQYLFDSFGDSAQFLVASLNFETYRDHLKADQDKLSQKIAKLQKDLENNPNSEKKKNQIREFSDQHHSFDVRIDEANDFIKKYGSQDVALAASLFIFTQQELTYFFSGSLSEFNKFYAPALLQETAMLMAIERGITRYNLLGIQGIFDGSDGVLKFKQNFNGYIERRPGSFFYYPNPLKYKTIHLLKKALGRL